MRRFLPWFLTGVILLLPVNALVLWLNWGEVRFRTQLLAFDIDQDEARTMSGIHVNTYTDEVDVDTVERCYEAACRRLDSLRGNLPRRTYYCEDEMTYPSVSSVVQFSWGYAEVEAYEGNDSRGASVRVRPGLFLAEKGTRRPVRSWSGPVTPILR